MPHVYPIYLVIDASDSMNEKISPSVSSPDIQSEEEAREDDRDFDYSEERETSPQKLIDYALNIPKEFYREYENNVSLEEQLLVCVIAFNRTAEVVHKLSSVKELANFTELHAKSSTYYSEAFRVVKEQIELDYATADSENWKQPAVIFVTDGGPSDPPKIREHWFNQLVNKGNQTPDNTNAFEHSPHFIVFAFKDVKREILLNYVSDPELLFIADKNKSLKSQFNQIIRKITETTFTSVYADAQNSKRTYKIFINGLASGSEKVAPFDGNGYDAN